MKGRPIVLYTRAEFDAVRERLEAARDALLANSCRLQSVARAYYVVYVTAAFVAGKYGVQATHWRGGERVTDQAFSHNELPDVIYTLYTGTKRGNVSDPGSTPGIGSGNYDEGQASRKAAVVYEMRLEADYGPTPVREPYDEVRTGEWISAANNLVQDLETIL